MRLLALKLWSILAIILLNRLKEGEITEAFGPLGQPVSKSAKSVSVETGRVPILGAGQGFLTRSAAVTELVAPPSKAIRFGSGTQARVTTPTRSCWPS